MSAQILTIMSLIASGIALIFAVYAVMTSTRSRAWRKYFLNKDAHSENFEEIVEHIVTKLEDFDSHAATTSATLNSLAAQLNTATQHVGIVRYNGMGDDGGNLSFSAALLDAHQSGIIITSLHGRANNRIYAKVITQGTSEQVLSEEEREAVIQALTGPQEIPTNKTVKQNRK